MASIIKRHSGYYAVQFIWLHKYQSRITLTTKNMREALRVADYIQEIIDSKRNGTSNRNASLWIEKIANENSVLYQKLVKHKLVEKLEQSKTLKELFTLFLEQSEAKDTTKRIYQNVESLMMVQWGQNRRLDTITTEDATRLITDMKTLPLDRRTHAPKVYSPATVAGFTSKLKSVFHFAEKVGWIQKSPFRFQKIGNQSNRTKWKYVSKEQFDKFVETVANVKYRVMLMLGRYAGCRGDSELLSLTWNSVDFENKIIVIHATKKEAFDDVNRAVPLNSKLMKALKDLKEFNGVDDNSEKIFPGIRATLNTSRSTRKLLKLSGIEQYPEPWYNLRRSFCSDVLEAGVDPAVYEQVCGHSFSVGMQHYQIMHPDRIRRGIERVREALETN